MSDTVIETSGENILDIENVNQDNILDLKSMAEEQSVVEEIESTPEEIKDVEEPKVEIEEPVIAQIKPRDRNEDIFITEDDLFNITIRWYKKDGNVVVEGGDDGFDINEKDINEFVVTFKYPSQGDYEIIMGSTSYRSPDDMKISDIIQMELTRLITLIRGWSLKQEISRMVQLDPSIIKGMMKKVRDIIGMKGIL